MIRFLLKNSRWMLSMSMLCGLLSGLGGVGLVAVINTALGGEQNKIAGLGWLFAGLCVLLLTARAASALLLLRLGQNVIFDLRLKLSRQILKASLSNLQQLGPARILASLTDDVTTLAESFRWLPLFCINAAIVAGCLGYLGWLSGALFILVAVTIAIGISSFRLITKQALRGLRTAREYNDDLYGHFKGLTQGIKELKLHRSRRDAFLNECLETSAAHYRSHYTSGMSRHILANNWGNGLFYVLIGVALFLMPDFQHLIREAAARFGLFSMEEVTPQMLRGYCLTILYMISPLTIMMESLPVFERARVALKKVQKLSSESEAQEIAPDPAILPFCEQASCLEMIDITHSYHSDREERSFMLGPVNLTLNPGEIVFLIGGNGSGKTTLALLLAGLYNPEQGKIRLGGCEVTYQNRELYRQQFSAVFSDFYLFDSLLGFQNHELDADARAYLVHLQLDHKVQIDQGVFSTLNLSQGQRKRLALLVAYLEDRPFYLFDEWAADQDPVFKNIFYTEILPALKARGKTVVVITHDDGYFHLADRCLKLNDGRLTEIPVEKQETESCNNADNEWQQTELEMSS
ncbi:cyclic peptide export ABC transporter [Candidatus Methylospira mobilis]|uniref:cyclic peptide export ABC transporter n=1 Tax=Candidatus Methylospira mobilis TaxID=1808979 RepID=UPI0028EE17BF|nr:cyclic peptide export ABC transporter [Candidatus Methylospira mobilis]WNV05998.1 cyclic peptide export ABC transporter [Candidatus Methylospira mobilis]